MGTQEPNNMKLLLGLLGATLGYEITNEPALSRGKRSDCGSARQYCSEDIDAGFYESMEECLTESAPDCLGGGLGGGMDAEQSQCQDYSYDGFKMCCPPGLDVDSFWPMERPNLEARGPRPLAPNELCPNGCDIATQVDQFVCGYFKRVDELNQLFNELEKFMNSDLKEIIDFKTQFVRRYNEVEMKSKRSAAKIAKITELIKQIVYIVQDNEKRIKELEGEVSQIELKIKKIDLDLENLHQFCKIGKQCAKKCFFEPELFGGIKKDCAEYYHSNYWKSSQTPDEWQNMPQSGVYIIQPRSDLAPKYVYCDQKTDGGGWTLLQHKGISNSSNWEKYDAPLNDPENPNKYRADWHQPMSAYENGFGWVSCNGESDYWMGLDYMSALTYRAASGPVKVRIDIKDWDNRDYWGNYDTFAIKPKNRGYQMIAKGYSGVGSYSIGDAFDGVAFDGEAKQQGYTRSSGMRFSTKDQDNDMFCKARGTYTNAYGMTLPRFNADDKAAQCESAAAAVAQTWQTDETFAKWGSCAGQDGAGFWYNRCSAGNINGRIYKGGYYALKTLEITNSFTNQPIMRDHDDGLIWGTLGKGRDYSFMLAEMRVRPRNFQTRHQMLTTRRGGAAPEDERMHERGN